MIFLLGNVTRYVVGLAFIPLFSLNAFLFQWRICKAVYTSITEARYSDDKKEPIQS